MPTSCRRMTDLADAPRRLRRRGAAAAIAACAAVALVMAGCSSSPSKSKASAGGTGGTAGSSSALSQPGDPAIGAAGSGPVLKTVGPNGEKPAPASSVTLTPKQVSELKKGHYTAAMVWHEAATFTSGVTAGARAEFARLGINVSAVTQANFDSATQTNQLQTVEAEHPSVVLSLPVDPVTEAAAYRNLHRQGTKLVVLSNVPKGLKWPTEYAGMVTDDLANMGREAAVLLGTAMHGQGDVGLIYYSANYYVTNERDAALRTWLRKLYPNIHIVDQEAMADQSKAQTVATAMLTRHPSITGIYAPWSQTPGEGVLAALRSLGRTDVKVVTMDLDPTIDASMCQGQYLAGIVADQPYLLGKTMADVAGLSILGAKTPAFTDVKALQVTKSNILPAWKSTLAQSAPSNVQNACG